MNINDLKQPVIKPTRTPSIVKDQDKERRFIGGQTLSGSIPASNTTIPTRTDHTTRAAPDAHAALKNLYFGRKPERPTRNGTTASQIVGWFIFIFFGLPFIIGIVAGIYEAVDEVDTGSEFSSPTKTDGTLVTAENECFKLDIPDVDFIADEPAYEDGCEFDFSNVYAYSRTNFELFDGELGYNTLDELLSSELDDVVERGTTTQDVEYAVVQPETATDYHVIYFWVNDRGYDFDDQRIAAFRVSVYQSLINTNDNRITYQEVIDTIEFK